MTTASLALGGVRKMEDGGVSFQGAGIIGVASMLIGMFLKAFMDLRKMTLAHLADRVIKLEADLEAERENCEKDRRNYRHELRQQDQKIFGLMYATKVTPEQLDATVDELRRRGVLPQLEAPNMDEELPPARVA